MGKAKHTPKVKKDDNPFKLKSTTRKLRWKKKCKSKALDVESLNQTFRDARVLSSSTVAKPQQPQDKIKVTPATHDHQRIASQNTTAEEYINSTIDSFAHL